MSQTTFAIMALAAAMLIAVAQIRWTMQTQYRLVDDELEVMASGIARQVLEYAESRSFDERTTPPAFLVSPPASPSDFDVPANFGNMPACNLNDLALNLVECDDIDDLHMDSTNWQTIPFVMQADTMQFEVNIEVYYVNDTNPETQLTGTNRSETKEIVVRVRSPIHVQQNRFVDGLVTIKRLFVYDFNKENDRALAFSP